MGLINDKHGGSTEAKEIMCDQRTEEVIKSFSERSPNRQQAISKSTGSLKLRERLKPLCLYATTGVKLFYRKILFIKGLIYNLNWRWRRIYSKSIMGNYRPRWTWKYLRFTRKSIRMKRPINLLPVSSQSITIINSTSMLCPGGVINAEYGSPTMLNEEFSKKCKCSYTNYWLKFPRQEDRWVNLLLENLV